MIAYRVENASTWSIIGIQIAVGIGGGFLNVPAQLGVQASASHQQVAAATTIFLTILEVGGAVGSAVSGAIWSTYVPRKLQQYLPPNIAPNYATIYGDLNVASNYTLYPVGYSGLGASIFRRPRDYLTSRWYRHRPNPRRSCLVG